MPEAMTHPACELVKEVASLGANLFVAGGIATGDRALGMANTPESIHAAEQAFKAQRAAIMVRIRKNLSQIRSKPDRATELDQLAEILVKVAKSYGIHLEKEKINTPSGLSDALQQIHRQGNSKNFGR